MRTDEDINDKEDYFNWYNMVVDHLHATIKTTKFVLKEKKKEKERG